MGSTRLKTLLQLCVIYWFSELGASQNDVTLALDGNNLDNTTVVNPGSNITFSCNIHRGSGRRSFWYKDGKRVALFSYNNNCKLTIEGDSQKNMMKEGCEQKRYSIVLTNIQKKNEGLWQCRGEVFGTGMASQEISLKVKTQTDSSPTPTTSNTILPAKSSGTTHSTHTQSTKATTGGTLQSTHTQSTTATTGKEVRTHRKNYAPRHSQSNNMIVIGGSIGGAILILVIIIVVVISLRARKNSQSGDKRPGDKDRDGTQRADEAVVFDDDFGGQYAQIGITGAAASTSPNQKEKNRKETEDDEMIVAENTLYESYNKEEHDKGSGTGASVCEVGADVYSVVQKPPKSQGQSSNKDGNQASGSQPSGPDGTDVYSVVQKPLKLEVKAKVQSPDDGVGDVYSLAKKPAKN